MSESNELIGESPAMLAVFRTVARVADSSVSVVVQGESGTGKERVARLLHQYSSRRDGPFVAVNCAAIPDSLLESELFGHEKGAFTGAAARREGRFERANGGTLFLDEIGDMGLALQAKILRALQEREIERLGAERPTPIDVRVVAATHRDLAEEVRQGRFREDLYYRLAVVVITLPPLRERGDDVTRLVVHSVARAAQEHGRRAPAIAAETMTLLRDHPWPGNVRQLRNALDCAVLMAEGPVLLPEHLPHDIRFPSAASDLRLGASHLTGALDEPAEMLPLEELERRQIQRALVLSGGHLTRAAEALGIHRNTLRRKIQEHHLDEHGAAEERVSRPACGPGAPPSDPPANGHSIQLCAS